jgi:hypothetical protein
MSRPYLFWGQSYLTNYLDQRLAAMRDAVNRVPEEHAAQADADAWAEALGEAYEVLPPQLGESWMDRPAETEVDVSHEHFLRAIDDPSTPTYIPGWRATFHIPFEGDAEVFRHKTSTYTTVLCDGAVRGSELVHTVEYPHDRPMDLDAEATRWRQDVEKWLGWATDTIKDYQRRFRDEARLAIAQRRARIAAQREQLAKTKTPIGPPEERNKVSISEAIVRKPSPVPRLRASREAPASRIELEPALQDEVFEHILEVLRDTGAGMESAPGTYGAMGEEDRRNVFSNNLNTHYRGQAAAEAFHRAGHTDILVTDENKCLFIAECKIWHGPKSLTRAIDQLFGYAAWRDTKTALVIFVGEQGFTDVVARARETLAEHPQFNEWQEGGGESESRATMTWPGDPAREIDLALTLFHIPSA